MNNNEKIKFLGKVYINLKRSELAYRNYIDNDKKFIFARIIKHCNKETLNLLTNNSYLLSDNLISDSIELISHIDIWIEKWNDLAETKKPSLDDEFIFENEFTFPRKAAENLENEFLKIRTQED